MPQNADIQRAMAAGARRSREACARVAGDSTLGRPAEREALTPEVVWRRLRWPIIGLIMFALIEILGLASIAGARGHF